MLAVKSIEAIYDEAGWLQSPDEFAENELRKVHKVELDNDLIVCFQVLNKYTLFATAKIFDLSEDISSKAEKLRKASQLLVSVNAEHSLSSSVIDNSYYLELVVNTESIVAEQVLYLVQNFLDDCDIFIAKIKELDEALTSYYGRMPLEFMIN